MQCPRNVRRLHLTGVIRFLWRDVSKAFVDIGTAKHCLEKHVLAFERFHGNFVLGMEKVLPLTITP